MKAAAQTLNYGLVLVQPVHDPLARNGGVRKSRAGRR